MAQTYTLFHGSPLAGLLGILKDGSMRPQGGHILLFSERMEDTLQHGTDRQHKASFAFKAEVTIVEGASVKKVFKHGNPFTVEVTTTLPLPVKLLELYVRRGQLGEFKTEIIKGADAIRAYLLKL